jgi:DNA repair ATPase RecN
MRAKLIIKEEKKRYDEHLERAREVSHLASQLVQSYEATRAFNSEDNKKLERLEKLTKRIRNEAGGSDTDPDVKDLPADTVSALKSVAEMAEDLRKMVEKTPRHVISAAVIDQANKLIGIIQFVRNPGRQGAS